MTDEAQEDDSNVRSRTIFCGNLSERVTEELLYELFLQVRNFRVLNSLVSCD